ncbi:MAG: hypothetical protein AB7G75_35430 [Candidatus Binatia bacterium]
MQRQPILCLRRLFLAWLWGLFLVTALPHLSRAQTLDCPIFPADNIWNTRVDTLPTHPSSSTYINTIGPTAGLHADFGTVWNGAPNGIPFTIVPSTQPLVPIIYTAYGNESDPGPFPLPTTAAIEGGTTSTGDRHVLVVQTGTCKLYELFNAHPLSGGAWSADSGAVWNLRSHTLRPDGWTSADAAGLPIYPGLVRYDEIRTGEIRHALRFTVSKTQSTHLWPARHHTSPTGSQYPPMGLRLRLKASFDISTFSRTNQILLQALKIYGMIVSDNGSAWYISGAPDSRWNDDDLHQLSLVKGSNFEVVDESGLQVAPDSGQARQDSTPPPPCTQIPPFPSLLAPTPGSVFSVGPITLDWADTNCAISYRVLVRQSFRRGATVYQNNDLTTSQAIIPALPKGKYYWNAYACNSYGCNRSEAWQFTVR